MQAVQSKRLKQLEGQAVGEAKDARPGRAVADLAVANRASGGG